MWKIKNKYYDLSKFANSHPGGKEIIENTKNIGDITALFETYHAFSNKQAILKVLDTFEITDIINGE